MGAALLGAASTALLLPALAHSQALQYCTQTLHHSRLPPPGKGAFGVVRLALDKKTGQMYACKSISKVSGSGRQPEWASGCCWLHRA